MAQKVTFNRAEAIAEAKQVLDTWPAMPRILDKVAVVILEADSDRALRRIIDRKLDTEFDYSGALDYFFAEAMRCIPGAVADFAACKESDGASVAELMRDAARDLGQIKASPVTQDLADAFAARIAQARMWHVAAATIDQVQFVN